MGADLVKDRNCSTVKNDDGFYFFDKKRYQLQVGLSSVLMNRHLCGLNTNYTDTFARRIGLHCNVLL